MAVSFGNVGLNCGEKEGCSCTKIGSQLTFWGILCFSLERGLSGFFPPLKPESLPAGEMFVGVQVELSRYVDGTGVCSPLTVVRTSLY